jgi:hypothetical protein
MKAMKAKIWRKLESVWRYGISANGIMAKLAKCISESGNSLIASSRIKENNESII